VYTLPYPPKTKQKYTVGRRLDKCALLKQGAAAWVGRGPQKTNNRKTGHWPGPQIPDARKEVSARKKNWGGKKRDISPNPYTRDRTRANHKKVYTKKPLPCTAQNNPTTRPQNNPSTPKNNPTTRPQNDTPTRDEVRPVGGELQVGERVRVPVQRCGRDLDMPQPGRDTPGLLMPLTVSYTHMGDKTCNYRI
jgi:hypothetical protein